jgi:hypothetical protein
MVDTGCLLCPVDGVDHARTLLTADKDRVFRFIAWCVCAQFRAFCASSKSSVNILGSMSAMQWSVAWQRLLQHDCQAKSTSILVGTELTAKTELQFRYGVAQQRKAQPCASIN